MKSQVTTVLNKGYSRLIVSHAVHVDVVAFDVRKLDL